ncbi:MAG: cell division protein FtsZ [Bacteroidales bacterium]|nr:cell division protein FtsZ [Bacteroidales bacterium]
MTDLIKFDPMEEMPNFIKVLGVGGGGSNAVTHMFTEGIQGVDFILCNTDHQALEKSPVATKVHLGKRHLGAGNIPSEGRKAALETVEELREILAKDTKMLFITAGMGGGTGTGAAPIVASIARELDILTVGIVTLPFSFEGKRRHQQALEGIAELRKHVDSLLVVSNDKLRQEHGNMKLTQAFKKADDVLKTAAKGIAEIITVTGYVNVDFQDVNTVMRNSGKAIMGSGYSEGENRAEEAVRMAVDSPLLDDSDIRGAKNILVYITSGDEEVSLDEVTQIVEYVQDATGNCSEVIWGNGNDESLGNGLNVTLIATGFEYDELNEYEQDTRSKKIHEAYKDASETKNRVEEPKEEPVTPEVKKQPEIQVIIKKKDDPQPAPKPADDRKITVHHLGEDNNNNDDDDDLEIGRNYNNNQNYTDNNTSDRDATPSSPTVKTYSHNNPFSKDDDDEEFEIKSFTKNSLETQTAVKHEVKTSQDNEMSQQEKLRRERLSSLTMNYRSMSKIEKYENQPAYMRKGLNMSLDSQDQELSNYSFNKGKGISENNSFLHDNVD